MTTISDRTVNPIEAGYTQATIEDLARLNVEVRTIRRDLDRKLLERANVVAALGDEGLPKLLRDEDAVDRLLTDVLATEEHQ